MKDGFAIDKIWIEKYHCGHGQAYLTERILLL